MQIVKFPHPALFQRATDVTVFGEELLILLDAMFSLMVKAKGIGISANQVDLPFNALTMIAPDKSPIFIVNPRVISRSQIPIAIEEACLSAPGVSVVIKERVQWVQLKFQDETGKEHIRVFKGIYSICVDHEMDHLAGRSFLQYKSIPKQKRKEFAKKYGK